MPVRGILDSTLVELGYRLVPILQYKAFYFDIVVLIYIPNIEPIAETTGIYRRPVFYSKIQRAAHTRYHHTIAF